MKIRIIAMIIRLIPTNLMLWINEASLKELDRRGEIIWIEEGQTKN